METDSEPEATRLQRKTTSIWNNGIHITSIVNLTQLIT